MTEELGDLLPDGVSPADNSDNGLNIRTPDGAGVGIGVSHAWPWRSADAQPGLPHGAAASDEQ